jgi:hypothetical protein
METQNTQNIVPLKAEIIPSSDLPGLEAALAGLDSDSLQIEQLKAQAEAITVVNSGEQYAQAGQILTQLRGLKKSGANRMTPFLDITKRVTDFLRNKRSVLESKVEAVDGPLSRKMEDYKRREREAAAAEQRRINEERERLAREEAERKRKEEEERAAAERKAQEKQIEDARKAGELNKREAEAAKREAERQEQLRKEEARKAAERAAANVQPVQVAPAVPKVSGLRGRVVWKFKIVDETQIPRSFLTPDEVKIGQMVRITKNKNIAEANCPGIEVWDEDAV